MRVVTFGELLLRLNPPGYNRFLQTDTFFVAYTGAEANVAVALSLLGTGAEFVTRLPENDIGSSAVNSIRRFGVRTEHIARGGERMGIMFLEKGASQRGGNVIYDRKHTAIAEASQSDFDWEEIFKGADWFHFTGITPALSEGLAEICLTACQKAKAAGVKISCDLNYRAKLWSKEEAGRTLEKMMPYIDVCISNVPQLFDVFGIVGANEKEVAEKTLERFPMELLALTTRKSLSASDNVISGALYTRETAAFSREYAVRIVDRVGGGDAFAGGLIHSLLKGAGLQKAVDFAVATSALKHSIEGDFCLVSEAEVEGLVQGDGSGRLRR